MAGSVPVYMMTPSPSRPAASSILGPEPATKSGTRRGPSSQARRVSTPLSSRARPPASSARIALVIASRVAIRAARCTLTPIVSALLPPVPMPSTMRPGAISSSVAMALAATDQWRVCGTVTPGPSVIRRVPSAHAASVTHSSRQTRCESVIQTVSYPSASASCACRTTSPTGSLLTIPTSNRISAARQSAPQPPTSEAAQTGPDARRRPRAAREAYSLYVERAAAGANEADGPVSAASFRR
jgi:hypothetical protein